MACSLCEFIFTLLWPCVANWQLADAIATGGDLMRIDRFGLSTLHHASICGHAEIVAYILFNSKFLCFLFGMIFESNVAVIIIIFIFLNFIFLLTSTKLQAWKSKLSNWEMVATMLSFGVLEEDHISPLESYG